MTFGPSFFTRIPNNNLICHDFLVMKWHLVSQHLKYHISFTKISIFNHLKSLMTFWNFWNSILYGILKMRPQRPVGIGLIFRPWESGHVERLFHILVTLWREQDQDVRKIIIKYNWHGSCESKVALASKQSPTPQQCKIGPNHLYVTS